MRTKPHPNAIIQPSEVDSGQLLVYRVSLVGKGNTTPQAWEPWRVTNVSVTNEHRFDIDVIHDETGITDTWHELDERVWGKPINPLYLVGWE